MSKKNDTWMPLYIGDYLADTSRLSTEQHGAYLLILMDYWRNGPPLDDDEELASITKLSVAQWRKHAPKIRPLFSVDGGRLIQKRADEERARAGLVSSRRSVAGKQGAAKRWGKKDSDAIGKTMANAIAKPMANVSQNDGPSQSQSEIQGADTPADDRPPPAGAGAPTHTHEAQLPVEPQAPPPPPPAATAPTPAAALCRQLKTLGFSRVNPGNQRLQMLLDAGATPDEFMAHTAKALEHGEEPFAFLLGIVEGERKRAARVAGELHRGPMPMRQAAAPPPQSYRERDQEAAMRRWEEATGRVHPDRAQPPLQFPAGAHAHDVIDMEPVHPALEHDHD